MILLKVYRKMKEKRNDLETELIIKREAELKDPGNF